jgi:myo-inositol-1(or 4)-monophosphatase
VNDQPLAVSTTAALEQSLLTTGFPYDIRETRETNLAEYAAFAVRCPGSLFVEEAGGRVTDLVGGALDLDAPRVVASNGRIHDAMLAVLRKVREV